MKRFVVIGLGNFGASVAESLQTQRHDVLAIDRNEDAVERIAPLVSRAVVGDGRVVKLLEKVGAKGANAGVVSTGDDITASILATMALRDLAVKEVYVKVISTDHARVMEKLGVQETIFPERESGMRLAARISTTSILEYVPLGGGFSVQEIAVPNAWIGRPLRALELSQRFRVSVIAVHDMLLDEITAAPDPDAPLKESDTLLLAGKDEDLKRAASRI